jgi:hypothetical protein
MDLKYKILEIVAEMEQTAKREGVEYSRSGELLARYAARIVDVCNADPSTAASDSSGLN